MAVTVETFEFRNVSFNAPLHRRSVEFDGLPIEHHWLDTRGLYGQRGRSRADVAACTELYWLVCQAEGACEDRGSQETFLLASLLPWARPAGSQRIMPDARLWSSMPTHRDHQAEHVRQLNQLIAASRDESLNWEGFRDRTATALAIPEFTNEVRHRDCELISILLDEAHQLVPQDPIAAFAIVAANWRRLKTRFGRRAGHSLEKQALDAISYDCRAAFHRCYSLLWSILIPELHLRERLSLETCLFLGLWHTEKCVAGIDGAIWRLFHGHILGLHPASATLMQTEAGRDCIGRWLREPHSADRFGQLLHAIHLGVQHYVLERENRNSERKRLHGNQVSSASSCRLAREISTMSMTGQMYRVSPSRLQELLDHPTQIEAELYPKDFPANLETHGNDVEKTWGAIEFVLGRLAEDEILPQIHPLLLGEETGSVLHYGPVWYRTPTEVSEIAEVLSHISRDDFRTGFIPQQMSERGVYPDIWDGEDQDALFQYVWQHYETMVRFYQAAAGDGDAMLLHLA